MSNFSSKVSHLFLSHLMINRWHLINRASCQVYRNSYILQSPITGSTKTGGTSFCSTHPHYLNVWCNQTWKGMINRCWPWPRTDTLRQDHVVWPSGNMYTPRMKDNDTRLEETKILFLRWSICSSLYKGSPRNWIWIRPQHIKEENINNRKFVHPANLICLYLRWFPSRHVAGFHHPSNLLAIPCRGQIFRN